MKANTSEYTDEVVADLKVVLLGRVERIAASGGTLPPAEDLARLLSRALPDVPEDLDPHFADLAPFYDSAGAMNQLGGVSKQALAGRRQTNSVLAMRSGDGTWLYPAWQFSGDGRVRPALGPVLKSLRGVDGWIAGVWLTTAHPDLGGASPRAALRNGVSPVAVAGLAAHDMAALVA
ncbi:hypothetical protein [Nocardioides alcanivorans]|uniref:hypothetical protein n=1 Tax=Nocardioides alcanivorans TaxID=2897352 RepID=UPI001F1E5AEA|nr:hypothetical protein [Nocardioides alcanivorans]